MKNKSFLSIVGAIIIIGGVAGIYQYSASTASANLSLEEAQTKAQQQFPGDVVDIDLNERGNNSIYEIEIEGSDYSYELELDANSGEILHLEEKELKDKNNRSKTVDDSGDQDDQQTANEQQGTQNDDAADDKDDIEKEIKQDQSKKATNEKSSKTPISKEQAIEIAVAEINSGNPVVQELELDEDDGYLYYEMELITDKKEVEIEIDAYTGAIIALSIEDQDD